MRITTMLNAMEKAKWMLNTCPYDDVALRQYHAIRDGIHRRWLAMDFAIAVHKSNAEYWEQQAKALDDGKE